MVNDMRKINIDTKLYKQMLKRLLIPAIVMGAICVVISIINMASANAEASFYNIKA